MELQEIEGGLIMALPIDPGKVKRVADKIQKQIDVELGLDIFIDNTCNEDFLESLKNYFECADETVQINYKDVHARPIALSDDVSFAIIIAGQDANCASVYNILSQSGIAKIVVCVDPGVFISHLEDNSISFNKNEIICPDLVTYSRNASDPESVNFDDYNGAMDINIKDKLTDYIYSASETMEIAYAQMFPFLRTRIANNIIYTCSLENGGIGIIKILPGADMPLMTLNQIRMLLQLAAIYGYKINEDRVIEIISIVVAAFGMRYISNKVKKNSAIPKFLVDGTFGVSATVVLGNLAKEYFASGMAIDGLVDKCKAFFIK